MPRRIRSAFVILVALMTLAACSDDPGPPAGAGAPAADATASPTTTGGARPDATTSEPVTSSPTRAPGSTGSTTQPPTDTSSATPPRAGVYRYNQDGASSISFFAVDPEGTLEVARATAADGGQRQTQTRTLSQNQQMEQVYRFASDGVYLESATQRVYGQEMRCAFDEPLRVLALPLEVGKKWSGSGTCEGVEVSLDARVTKTQMRTVGGTSVQTFVIRSTYRAAGDGFEQETTSTTWLSPEHGLIVRSTQKSSGTQGTFSYSSSLTEQLVSLTPS